MQIKPQRDKELSMWAHQFTQERRDSIDYFLEHGSPIERALVNTVIELAGGDDDV
ncbi:hypothetical protein [Methanolobus sp. WCC5]|uniref:hypothetical protein n=1 Tax=Methanolobus sp. WCC5 TaxID=3125785 RepID=UPI003246A2C3